MKVSAALILSFACLLTASISTAASEKVHKWTDSKGVTHYGQRPPANTQTEVLRPQTGHSAPVTYAPAPGAGKIMKSRCWTLNAVRKLVKTWRL
jgi:hypothetical protein